MLKPAYKLTLGEKIIDTTSDPHASTLVDLVVTLDLDTPADSFELTLAQVGSLKPVVDDQVIIDLGYADSGSLETVLTGSAVWVDQSFTQRRVSGYGTFHGLLRTFPNQTYLDKTAADIIEALAAMANVTVAEATDGIRFPAYVTDSRRSAYHHMHDIADLCGFDIYANQTGELVFKQFFSGTIIHVLEYAKHVIRLDTVQTPPSINALETWGESPASRNGAETWGWLVKDFGQERGTQGSGDPKRLLEAHVLRTTAAARTAAAAAFTSNQRQSLRGRVLILGQADVRLGDAIRLKGVPDDALNGVHQVRSVIHRLNKRDGFTTEIGFRRIDSATAGA